MENQRMQKVYKIIMLIAIVATITFVCTTIFIYQNIGDNIKYVPIAVNDSEISTTLASFRKIVDEKFLGEINQEKLVQETIKGYIKGLDDPYTEYMTKEEMEEFNTDVMGNFSGIGIYVTNDTERNAILIISPIKDSPAANAGILPGDIITKVDDVSYTGEQLTEATLK